MHVRDLIEELEQMIINEEIDEYAEVRFASQPNYPLEYTLSSTMVVNEGKVYLGEGRQVGYLKGIIKEELGW